MEKQTAFGLVLAATFLAALLRWVGLLSLPPQAWQDELWFALRAREILQTGEFPLFYKTFWGGVNPLMVWLTAGAEWLGFRTLPVASRWVSTTFGILSVPLAFACWREIECAAKISVGRGAPVLAAFVLATFFFTITLSRIGTEPAVALAASLFCLWQQRRATRLNAPLGFVLAGLGAGLAQYISPHARFIPVVMLLWGVHDLWPFTHWRRWLTHYLLLTLAFVLAFSPLLNFFINEPEWFWGRARAVTVGAQAGLGPFLLNNLQAMLLGLVWVGDANARDNLAFRPLLDPLQALGLLLGLGAVIFQLRRSASARYMLLWLGVMLIPTLITDNAPSFSRMMLAAPPLAWLIVHGWLLLWQKLSVLVNARWVNAIAGAGLLASLFWNGLDYFSRYASQPQLPQVFTTQAVNLAHELTRRAATESVFVSRTTEAPEENYAFEFMLSNSKANYFDLRQCLPLVNASPTRATYVVQSDRDTVTVPDLLRQYPNATATAFTGEPEALYTELTLVEIPANTTMPTPPYPAHVEFAPGLRLVGYEQSTLTAKPGEGVFFTFYWQATAPILQAATAFLHVGEKQVLQHDGQPCQNLYALPRWRVGEVVPDRFALTIVPGTPPGIYPLVIGWYSGNQRLTLTTAEQPLADQRAIIGTLTIQAP
jgi:hypothetical protein